MVAHRRSEAPEIGCRLLAQDEPRPRQPKHDGEDHGKARLYAEFGSIATDSQHLLIRASDWEMIDYFTVPIDIEVYSKSPVSRERLIERLQAALSFSVNYPKSGTGPDGALVISSIDWSKLVREEPAT